MSGKVVACIIARTVSTRLPLKVLRSIGGETTMLDFMIRRLKNVSAIDEIFICTSDEAVDEIMEDIAERNKVRLFRGSPDNVIDRMLKVGEITDAEILLRITGDNPFTSAEYISAQIDFLRREKLDYVRLIDVPIGATAEVMTRDALTSCYSLMDPSVSEYLMLFIFEPQNFKCGVIKPFVRDYSNFSVTVDTPKDLIRTRSVLEKFSGRKIDISLARIVSIMEDYSLPYSKIEPSGQIKLPYGRSMNYIDFAKDMRRRIDESKFLGLYE